MNNVKLLYIDLFCGAGGTSTGVARAQLFGRLCARVVACVDLDANAIASHLANHAGALHFKEDIRTLDLGPLVSQLRKVQKKYQDAYIVLWASLECTNFSKAKGGRPRDTNSRDLAVHLFRYIEVIRPDYIQIENVVEFMDWGLLDAAGKPVRKDKGRCYINWVKNVRSYGYNYDYRILNAADFGAYTSRKRFFGLFARYGLPIAFPVQNYAKDVDDNDMFHIYKKWRPVREVLDLADEGASIFTRLKPLSEKTLGRIYAGLVKFVAGNLGRKLVSAEQFLLNPQYNSGGGSIDQPCFTLIASMDKIPPYLITTKHGNDGTKINNDSPMTQKIKDFMVNYDIEDIKMRMLSIKELKLIMGFPEDYTLIGTQAEQKRFIGNAVEVNMSKVLCEALAERLFCLKKGQLIRKDIITA